MRPYLFIIFSLLFCIVSFSSYAVAAPQNTQASQNIMQRATPQATPQVTPHKQNQTQQENIQEKGKHILIYQMTGLFVLLLIFAAIFFATIKKVDMKWIVLAISILLSVSVIRKLFEMFH